MSEDKQFLIECLASELTQMLMEDYGWDMKRALDELYSSLTFYKLNDAECGLYYQGAIYVYDYLKSEIETGRLA